jgi:hypothetical protein
MMQRHDIENTVRVPFLSGLADHSKLPSFRVASSYEATIRESMNGGYAAR